MAPDQKKLRLLVVGQHFWPENFRINEIVGSLLERGYSIDILCGIPNYPKGEFFPGYSYLKPRKESFKGAKVYRVGEIPQTRKWGNLSISANFLFFPLSALLNLPRLWHRKYDLIFIYAPSPVFMAIPGIILGKLRKLPIVLDVLDYWPDGLFSVFELKSKVLRWMMTKISYWQYNHSDQIITPSQGMKDRMQVEVPVPASKIEFLPQSCEAFYEKLEFDPDLHERFKDRFNFVFAGNLGPSQDLPILVEAADILRRTHADLRFRFLLVGDGMNRIALQQLIIEKGLESYFAFEGQQPATRVPAYHEVADALLVCLGPNDLFKIMIPGKLQSYCAAGKPILAVLTGEGADIIRENNLGFVSGSGDVTGLVQNIINFMSTSEDERMKMGENGHRLYHREYRHDVFMDRLENILNKPVKRS